MSATSDLAIAIRVLGDAERDIRGLGTEMRALGGHVASAAPSFGALSTAMAAGTVAANLFVGGVRGLIGIFKEAADSGMEFGQSMANIKATLPKADVAAFGTDLENLALKLGKDYPLSAAEAGKAMELLAQKGIKAEDILKGGAEAVVKLSSATGGDLVTSAGIAAVALDTFNLNAEDMGRVTDVMTAAVLRGGMTVEDFGHAMQSGGAAVRLAGGTIDDTALALAALAKAGIEGSDAGTSLKTMYTNLIPKSKEAAAMMDQLGLYTIHTTEAQEILVDTLEKAGGPVAKNALEQWHKGGLSLDDLYRAAVKVGGVEDIGLNDWALQAGVASSAFFDTAGNARSFEEISIELARATKNLTNEQKLAAFSTIFGSDALRAAATAARLGAGEFGDLAEQMREQGIAADAAAKKNDTLKGDLNNLSGTWETIQIVLFRKVEPAIRAVTQAINRLLGAVLDFAQSSAFDDALTQISGVVEDAKDWVADLGDEIINFSIDVLAKIPVVGELFKSMGIAIGAAVIAVVDVLDGNMGGALDDISEGTSDLRDLVADAWGKIKSSVSATASALVTALTPLVNAAADLGKTLLPRVYDWLSDLLPVLKNTVTDGWQKLADIGAWLISNVLKPFVNEWLPPILGWLKDALPAAKDLALQGFQVLADVGSWLVTNVLKPFVSDWLPPILTWMKDALPAAKDLANQGWQKLADVTDWMLSNVLKPFVNTWLPPVLGWLKDALPAAKTLANDGWQLLSNTTKWLLDNVLQPFVNTWLPPIMTWLKDALPAAQALAASGLQAVSDVGKWLLDNVLAPLVNQWLPPVLQWFRDVLPAAQAVANDAWQKVADVGKWLLDNVLKPFVNDVLPPILDWFKDVTPAAKALATDAWQALSDVGSWLLENVFKPLVNDYLPPFKQWVSDVTPLIKDGLVAAWDALGQSGRWMIDNVWTPLADFTSQLWTRVGEKGVWDDLSTAFDNLWTAGKTLVEIFFPQTTAGLDGIGGESGSGPKASSVIEAIATTLKALSTVIVVVSDGIKSLAAGLKAISELPSTIPGWVQSIINSGGNALGAIGFGNHEGGAQPITQVPLNQPVRGGGGTPSNLSGYRRDAYDAAVSAGIDPSIFLAQIDQESGFNPDAYNAGSGATGIAQIMPGSHPGVDATDPIASLKYAAGLMRKHLDQYGGDYRMALAAYNAGPGNLAKYGLDELMSPDWAHGETKKYIETILGNAGTVSAGPPSSGVTMPFVQGQMSLMEQGLSYSEAIAACGPYAAIMFANSVGRYPSAQEAMSLAARFGWNKDQGMSSYLNTVPMINEMMGGANTAVGQAPTLENALAGLANGPIAINTPNHYFVATGYDPATGQFNVGGSGTVYQNGAANMTLEQMSALGGGLRQIITLTEQANAGFDAQTTALDGTNASLGDLQTEAAGATASIEAQYAALQSGGQANKDLVRDALPTINMLEQQGAISQTSAGQLRDMALAVLSSGTAASDAAPAFTDAMEQMQDFGAAADDGERTYTELSRTVRTSTIIPRTDTAALSDLADESESAKLALNAVDDVPVTPTVEASALTGGITLAQTFGSAIQASDDVASVPVVNGQALTTGKQSADTLGFAIQASDDVASVPVVNGQALSTAHGEADALGLSIRASDDVASTPIVNAGAISSAHQAADALGLAIQASDDVASTPQVNAGQIVSANSAAQTLDGSLDNVEADVTTPAVNLGTPSQGGTFEYAFQRVDALDQKLDDVEHPVTLGFSANVPSAVSVDEINVEDTMHVDNDLRVHDKVGASGAVFGGAPIISPGYQFQFAAGGRPPRGIASLVGELGPELFVPDQAGTILPAAMTAALLSGDYARSGSLGVMIASPESGGGTVIQINVTGNTMLGRDRSVAQELARIIRPEIDRLVRSR